MREHVLFFWCVRDRTACPTALLSISVHSYLFSTLVPIVLYHVALTHHRTAATYHAAQLGEHGAGAERACYAGRGGLPGLRLLAH
jgi:hypothetical protein